MYPRPPKELAVATAKATLNTLDEGLKRRVDVAFNVILHVDERVFALKRLADLLAPWVRELSSREALERMLRVGDFREEIREGIRSGGCGFSTLEQTLTGTGR